MKKKSDKKINKNNKNNIENSPNLFERILIIAAIVVALFHALFGTPVSAYDFFMNRFKYSFNIKKYDFK